MFSSRQINIEARFVKEKGWRRDTRSIRNLITMIYPVIDKTIYVSTSSSGTFLQRNFRKEIEKKANWKEIEK